MTDITTKLRQGQCSFELNGEACREIDRLRAEVAEKDAEIARLTEANHYLIGISNDAMEGARKYAEARREIARLREMLYAIVNRCEGQAKEIALAALAKAGVA